MMRSSVSLSPGRSTQLLAMNAVWKSSGSVRPAVLAPVWMAAILGATTSGSPPTVIQPSPYLPVASSAFGPLAAT